MKIGTIKVTRFGDLTSPKLKLELPRYYHQYHGINNCATAALSLLTGMTPRQVQSKCMYPKKEGWYVVDMVKFLKEKGFTVVEVTRNSVTNVYWKDQPVTRDHCLLAISWMNTEEASALVIHKGKAWHNMKIEKMNELYFVNKPTRHIYIIQHPTWR